MTLFSLVDLFGVSVFAVSGALRAREKKLDPIGFVTLGLVTATGGGVLRDAILGRVPPFVFQDSVILGVAVAVSLAVFAVNIPQKGLEYFDAVGLGFYSAMGALLALEKGLPPIPCVLVAVTSAVGGGVMREVMVHELPFIFRGTLYATASILGACVLLVAHRAGAPDPLAIGLASAIAAGLRILAIRFNWSLPTPRDGER